MKVKRPTALKTGLVLDALEQGDRLTVAMALRKLGVYALSQECGRLRRLGWPVMSRMITTRSGSRIAEYRLG